MKLFLFLSILIVNLIIKTNSFTDTINVDLSEVKSWSFKFGKEIHIGSTRATCYNVVENNYLEMGAKPVKRDASKIMEEMITDIENMFQWKIEHVRRIAERAEELAANQTFDSHVPFEFHNVKKLLDEEEFEQMPDILDKDPKYKVLKLTPNPLFNGVPVSYEESAVHIPVNVYEEAPALKKQIKWSISLKDIFRNNRVVDPDIYWQYFCSSNGFMQLYPAAKWRIPDFLKTPDVDRKLLDLYDCRMRDWFIKAAASSKDIVILLDGSGSMSGQRKEIARNVVFNILDTLTDDDYVTVLRFSDVIEPVVPCFGDRLVEANPQNIMLIKSQLTTLNTTDIANFTLALRTAFQILKQAGNLKNGALCNQAIMLVTDGAPDNDRLDHQTIFDEFNYPRIDIRMFSYLVGKEVTDTKEVNWMACKNKGYYTHVTNLAEIREQVQLYLPVMSRPLVLSRDRIYAFTNIYADVMRIPLNNWVWDAREREKIRQSIKRRIRETKPLINKEANFDFEDINDDENKTNTEEDDTLLKEYDYKQDKKINSNELSYKIKEDKTKYDYEDEKLNYSKIVSENDANNNYLKQKLIVEQKPVVPKTLRWIQNRDDYNYLNNGNDKTIAEDDTENEFNNIDNPIIEDNVDQKKISSRPINELMLTISAPVFDTMNTTNTTEKYLEKNVWRQRIVEVRSANLLGIVGVDVLLKEILKLTPAYRLGVNGYSFIINNNGHILYHPDLRPLFQDLVKPYYGSVDLTEVELQDDDANPRAKNRFDTLRSNMINRLIAWDKVPVKVHLDQMKRVVTRNQSYYTQPIKNTPFSMAIVLPENYGRFYISGQIEFKRRDENYTRYFKGDKWRVHPDWVYCDDDPSNKIKGYAYKSPEEGISRFLERAMQSEKNIRWKSPSLSPQVYEELTCNKGLVQSLIFDAKATDIDSNTCGEPKDLSRYEKDIADKFGINLTFIATRSGLSRFEEHYSKSWPNTEEYVDDKMENERYEYSNPSEENLEEDEDNFSFKEIHNRAVDETFYKRAVDFHLIDSQAFVFSAPHNAYRKPESLIKITGSKAIFIGSGIEKAPAAVVGLQIQLKQFADRFFNTTKRCVGLQCENVCSRYNQTQSSVNCLLIDNNGYVVVSSATHDHVGRFFGEIDYNLFTTLLDIGVFKAVRMYDYQAVCIELIERIVVGGSSSLTNLFTALFQLHKFLFGLLLEFLLILIDLATNQKNTVYMQEVLDNEEVNYNPTMYRGLVKDIKGKLLPPNRTRPYPCDIESYLYEMRKEFRKELLDQPIKKDYIKCDDCTQDFIISAIKNTNLLLLVYKDYCLCEALHVKITPKTIRYDSKCGAESRHVGRERMRLPKCNNYDPHEAEIKQCGFASSLRPNLFLILIASFILFKWNLNLNFVRFHF